MSLSQGCRRGRRLHSLHCSDLQALKSAFHGSTSAVFDRWAVSAHLTVHEAKRLWSLMQMKPQRVSMQQFRKLLPSWDTSFCRTLQHFSHRFQSWRSKKAKYWHLLSSTMTNRCLTFYFLLQWLNFSDIMKKNWIHFHLLLTFKSFCDTFKVFCHHLRPGAWKVHHLSELLLTK